MVGVSGAAHRARAAGRADAGDDAVPHGDGRDPAAGGDDGAGPLVAEHRGGDEPAGRPPVRVRRAHARVADAHDDLLLPRRLEVDLGEGDRALGVDGGEAGTGRQVGHAHQGRRERQVLPRSQTAAAPGVAAKRSVGADMHQSAEASEDTTV
jgi:hypothetical protein